VTFRVNRQAGAGGIEMGVFADAGKDVEYLPAERCGVLHAVGGEEGETELLR
jgi:hypothetical protein